MSEPRELTVDEIRARFIEYVLACCRFWATEPGKTPLERCDGVAFSIMVAIDGEAGALPAFMLVPRPCVEDEAFLRGQGENWYPHSPDHPYDISDGELHSRIASARSKT